MAEHDLVIRDSTVGNVDGAGAREIDAEGWSQEMLAAQSAQLSPEQQSAILSGNAADLYGIDVSTLAAA